MEKLTTQTPKPGLVHASKGSGNLLQSIIRASSPEELPRALLRAQSTITVGLALQQPNQISALRKTEPMLLEATISLLVEMLAESFNVKSNFSEVQVLDCTLSIIEKYWYLRPEEILYAFKRAKQGAYGPSYNKLDTPTVLSWLHRYDTEDRQLQIEQQRAQEPKEPLDIQAAYEAEKKRIEETGVPSLVAESRQKEQDRLEARRDEIGFQEFQHAYWEQRKANEEVGPWPEES